MWQLMNQINGTNSFCFVRDPLDEWPPAILAEREQLPPSRQKGIQAIQNPAMLTRADSALCTVELLHNSVKLSRRL